MARSNRNRLAKPHNVLVSQLAGTNSLPSLPHITAKLLELLDEPGVAVSELAEVIKLDPALSLNIMRLAQDRTPQAVPHVEEAASLVGQDTVAHLVRWSSTLDVFDTYSYCSPGDLTRFWAHSIKCAFLAEQLGREAGLHESQGAFLAGLLHDIGKLILLTHYPTKYKLRFSGSSSGKQRETKEEDLIVDEHAAVGAEVVRRWRHHSLLADSIHYHHHPADAVALAFPLVKVVYAANVLAKDESSGDTSFSRPEVSILELDDAQLERAVETTQKLFDETIETLAVDLTTAVKDAAQAPPSHTDAHTAVTGHVRDTSLLATLSYGLLHVEEADEVIRLVEQTLHGHFDIDRVVFFLIDDARKSLEAHGQCCSYVGELTVPLSYEQSAPVVALTEERSVECFVASGDTATSIIDEQIVRFLGKEGVVCLPMVVENDPVGTIVLGVDSGDRTAISGQKQFLDRLGRYAAHALQRCKLRVASEIPQQQDAVKSVVTLTRRAVHEVNNPLSIINNYLTVLSRKLAKHDIPHDEIRIISEEIARIKNILSTLVESSKNAAVSMEPVDLNALLSDLLRLMKDDLSIHNGIKVHSHLSSTLPKTLTDRDILKQAIINLLKNSAEALSDGGNIHIETEFVPRDNGADRPVGDSVENGAGKAKLIIRDDGPGIPDEIRAQLFQPFVTSKAQHEGLGLSIAHGLIQQLRGSITCDSETDSGTQFTICLPVVRS